MYCFQKNQRSIVWWDVQKIFYTIVGIMFGKFRLCCASIEFHSQSFSQNWHVLATPDCICLGRNVYFSYLLEDYLLFPILNVFYIATWWISLQSGILQTTWYTVASDSCIQEDVPQNVITELIFARTVFLKFFEVDTTECDVKSFLPLLILHKCTDTEPEIILELCQ